MEDEKPDLPFSESAGFAQPWLTEVASFSDSRSPNLSPIWIAIAAYCTEVARLSILSAATPSPELVDLSE